jgi:hypothetical protein
LPKLVAIRAGRFPILERHAGQRAESPQPPAPTPQREQLGKGGPIREGGKGKIEITNIHGDVMLSHPTQACCRLFPKGPIVKTILNHFQWRMGFPIALPRTERGVMRFSLGLKGLRLFLISTPSSKTKPSVDR